MQTLLQLVEVTKQYGACRALDAVSLEIPPGVTGLLGPNGAGKTTLIKILLGLVHATSGRAEVLGHPLPQQARAVRSVVGYLPEDDCYIPGLTGIEMVQYMARLSGQPATEGLRRSHEIIDFCGLHQERYRDVATYSTGMRQKLKFAQAIVHDPPLLILDEPSTGLDPDERAAMLGRIRWLAMHAGKTVLLSTHILPDVQSICDTVVIMSGGRVRRMDRIDVLRRSATPAIQVQLLGSADAFVREVEQAGYRVCREENGQLTVLGLDADASGLVWRWAAAAHAVLRSVTPARTSLEQTFRDAVQEAGRAPA